MLVRGWQGLEGGKNSRKENNRVGTKSMQCREKDEQGD